MRNFLSEDAPDIPTAMVLPQAILTPNRLLVKSTRRPKPLVHDANDCARGPRSRDFLRWWKRSNHTIVLCGVCVSASFSALSRGTWRVAPNETPTKPPNQYCDGHRRFSSRTPYSLNIVTDALLAVETKRLTSLNCLPLLAAAAYLWLGLECAVEQTLKGPRKYVRGGACQARPWQNAFSFFRIDGLSGCTDQSWVCRGKQMSLNRGVTNSALHEYLYECCACR